MWDYNEKVKQHFLNPKNVGVIEDADGVAEVGSMACGDALKLMFKVDENEKIVEVKFQTFGCGSAIASASALTEMLKGLTLEEAGKITNKQVVDYLGGLPEQKMHCSVMAHEALEAAINNYRTGKKGTGHEGKIVCTCFGVTEDVIEHVIKDNSLSTVEEVTNYCKAGGGCGGCKEEIEKIISRVRGKPTPVVEQKAQKKRLTNIEKIKLIQETIEREIRPSLRQDGGDIELIDVDGDRVVVSFRGTCAQCPVAAFTKKDVVEARLREFVSEEITVEEVKP